MKVIFTKEALAQYDSWISDDNKKVLDRIERLLESIVETPFAGKGKPEPLKYEFTGTWSRRINKKDRLRYRVTDDCIVVLSCRDHY